MKRSTKPRLKLIGERFGRLTVTGIGEHREQKWFWVAICDCGNQTQVRTDHLTLGRIRSCGCYGRFKTSQMAKSRATHGHTRQHHPSPEYSSWMSMWERCTRPSNASFKYYGARGITICTRWEAFENFLADMGPRPKGMSIDRWPNKDGNYEPGNCRWATAKEQIANRRKWKWSEDAKIRRAQRTVQRLSQSKG